jgi:hypothetical protein
MSLRMSMKLQDVSPTVVVTMVQVLQEPSARLLV